MLKRKKVKEKNKTLKCVFVALFVVMLLTALYFQRIQANSQQVASSSPLDAIFKFFTYSPQKSVQIGWFMVFYPTPSPAPLLTPTPTIDPCTQVNQNNSDQTVAWIYQDTPAPLPTKPPVEIPVYTPGPTNTPKPTKTPGPTRTPTLSPAPGAATNAPPYIPPVVEPCP